MNVVFNGGIKQISIMSIRQLLNLFQINQLSNLFFCKAVEIKPGVAMAAVLPSAF
jgi:hypothetical protein